jgi:hypothetical protein
MEDRPVGIGIYQRHTGRDQEALQASQRPGAMLCAPVLFVDLHPTAT